MYDDKKTFSHLSLQDPQSIKNILDAVSKGLTKGEMVFKDEDNEIVLTPDGLLRLKVSASKTEHHHKLNIKISWEVTDDSPQQKNSLSVSSTKSKR